MCHYLVLPRTPVRKLLGAAQNVQSLLDDGTLGDALGKNRAHAINLAITAFDVLAEGAANLLLLTEMQDLSPFLRYRREVLAEGDMAKHLRNIVMNLWSAWAGLALGVAFTEFDEHHTRIALEMIASYTRHDERDPQFMALAAEIRDMETIEEAA